MYIEQTVHFYLNYLGRENIPSHVDCHHHHHLFLRGSKMSQSFSDANLHCFLSFSFHKDSECFSDPRSWRNFKLCVMSLEVYRCEWNQFGSSFLFPHLGPQILQHWKDVLTIVFTLLGDPENLLPQNLMVTLDLFLYDIGWPNSILINQPFSISQRWNKLGFHTYLSNLAPAPDFSVGLESLLVNIFFDWNQGTWVASDTQRLMPSVLLPLGLPTKLISLIINTYGLSANLRLRNS